MLVLSGRQNLLGGKEGSQSRTKTQVKRPPDRFQGDGLIMSVRGNRTPTGGLQLWEKEMTGTAGREKESNLACPTELGEGSTKTAKRLICKAQGKD